MSSPDKELEAQLMEAGNKLQEPPASVEELLPLLDKLEGCLLKVEQSPTKSMQNALSPSLKALVADKLLRHSNVDVKVAVASCISEITRITAPDAPYDDDRMKEVFHLIVSSFENLSDKSSRSFVKRAAILETVAKVRSCVVMLDLECDALILEMFQHFLKSIRDYHPENVFTSMETIMILVIEESEEVSPDLLFPILASVRKDNEEVLPIARKLGETVLCNCAAKLKPCLGQVMKTLGLSSDDYCKIVASICKGPSEAMEQNEVPVTEDKVDDKVDKEGCCERTSSQGAPASDKSSKAAITNGVSQSEKKDSFGGLVSAKRVENNQGDNASKMASSNGEPDKLDNEDGSESQPKADPTSKKRGTKSNASVRATKSEAGSDFDGEKDAEKVKDDQEEISEDVPTSSHDNLRAEADVPSESAKETMVGSYSPKEARNESANAASPSHSMDLPDESRLPRDELLKSKDGSDEEVEPLAAERRKKASEGMGGTEIERDTLTENRGADSDGKSVSADDVAMKDTDATSDSEAKSSKHISKKVATGVIRGDGVSTKRSEDKKRKRSGNMNAKSKSSTKDDNKKIVSPSKLVIKSAKDESQLAETPKDSSKKKKIPAKGKASDADADPEALVGRKIRVWWPLDVKFYGGMVDSFDRKKKRHRVLYFDGDKEILNLKEEKWEYIHEDSEDEGQEGSDDESPDASEMPRKKKGKLKLDLSTNKQKERESSTKKGGVASLSKAKSASSSGKRPRDGNKVDRKPKEDDSSTDEESEDESEGKAKYHTPKSGNKAVDVAKMSGKSKSNNMASPKSTKPKNIDSGNDKVSTKTKHETPKSGKSSQDTKSALKEKATKSSGKSNANGPGRAKSGLSKSKQVDEEDDSAKKPENKKRNLSEASKGQGNSRSESGKKRRK